jgi:hypothetical protein
MRVVKNGLRPLKKKFFKLIKHAIFYRLLVIFLNNVVHNIFAAEILSLSKTFLFYKYSKEM